jgi:hypothetical protein
MGHTDDIGACSKSSQLLLRPANRLCFPVVEQSVYGPERDGRRTCACSADAACCCCWCCCWLRCCCSASYCRCEK